MNAYWRQWRSESRIISDWSRNQAATTTQPIPSSGNSFAYLSRDQIEARANDDTRRMVAEYDPTQELVLVLLKSGRISTYRVGAFKTFNLRRAVCRYGDSVLQL